MRGEIWQSPSLMHNEHSHGGTILQTGPDTALLIMHGRPVYLFPGPASKLQKGTQNVSIIQEHALIGSLFIHLPRG